MAFDLQFVQPRQLISVTQVMPLTEEVIRIIGSDFRSVDHVLLNGTPAPALFLESPTSLQAKLPAGLSTTTLASVEVMSRDLSLTETSRLSFALTALPSRATGVLRLVQMFLRILLSTPGSDAFDPSLGGGALRNLGQNFGSDQSGALVSDMVVAVDRTRKQIVNIQARSARLPPDEKLLDAKVTSTRFDSTTLALYVVIQLTAHSGRLAFANLALLLPRETHPMALTDFEQFLRERMRIFSETTDVAQGSPFDTQVIQPLLRRVGIDPFSIDAASFVLDTLAQQFPTLAASDTDAISDLLVKPALLLWDPILREIERIKNSLSFKDPSLLTIEEADAIGANLFSGRRLGRVARGIVRIYFNQPQPCSVNPNNFCSSRSGVIFTPLSTQSIKSTEMLLNKDGSVYYFDIQVQCRVPGEVGNIGPSEISSIANLSAAVRVTNRFRFRDGVNEESASDYIVRLEQELSEKSLVTDRGIKAQIPAAFPEITRLATTGHGDAEMHRDVLRGGGLGKILASGLDAQVESDGTLLTKTNRLSFNSLDLSTLAPTGDVRGFVVQLVDAFGEPPYVRDVKIAKFLTPTMVELEERVLQRGKADVPWSIRRHELTLGGMPGGILFPNQIDGSVTIPENEVHVGGCFDVSVRAAGPDSLSLILDALSDEGPALAGDMAELSNAPPWVVLQDIVLGQTYVVGDDTYTKLARAKDEQFSFEILDGIAAGVYRVVDTLQLDDAWPLVKLSPVPPVTAGNYRWRLLDVLEVNLQEPKERRVEATDGYTTQGLTTFSTDSSLDFDAIGAEPGDVLRLLNGPDKGDFIVKQVISPLYTSIEVDHPFQFSTGNVSFELFRPNKAGGVQSPLLRVTKVELLDTSSQPTGTIVPYGRPVMIRSRSFANLARGVKAQAQDARVGLLTTNWTQTDSLLLNGTLIVRWDEQVVPLIVSLAGAYSSTTLVAAINAVSQAAHQFDVAVRVIYGNEVYVGFLPVAKNVRIDPATSPSLVGDLFDGFPTPTSRSIRSFKVPDWAAAASPAIDTTTDAIQVVNGYQVGFFGVTSFGSELVADHDFFPQPSLFVRVGARSLGAARLYFLDPTSMEVDPSTVFTATTDLGVLRFHPDATLSRAILPPPPTTDKPKFTSFVLTTLTDNAQDFVTKGVRVGDEVVVSEMMLQGYATLADPVPSMAGKQFVLSLDGGVDKVVTFVADVATPNAVSRKGVVDQINATLGQVIATSVDVGSNDYRLRLDVDVPLVVRANQSSFSANIALGFNDGQDTFNTSQAAGTYTITAVDVHELNLSPSSVYGFQVDGHRYTIRRPGVQRISTAEMTDQKEGTLYYWDVELVSEGSGDAWNIPEDTDLQVAGYRADGYWLSTDNPDLTFSPAERTTMHFSRSILEPGVDDDLDNATRLTSQRMLITYDASSVTDNVQNFLLSEGERVICASPLARHLIPHYIRLDLTYTGGPKTDQARAELEDYIQGLLPDDEIEASDVQNVLTRRGATGVRNPVSLLAIVCDVDRRVFAVRSEDRLSTSRLASFLADVITLNRGNLPISTESPECGS